MRAYELTCTDCCAVFYMYELDHDYTQCPECEGRNFTHVAVELPNDLEEPWDGFNSDAKADADVLASAGWGTDEDYGHYGDDYRDEMGDSF